MSTPLGGQRANPTAGPVATREPVTPWWRRAQAKAIAVLPRGGALSEASWRSRHRGITAFLWAHIVGLVLIGLLRGLPVGDVLLEVAFVALFAVCACQSRLSMTTRSAMTTMGLVTASAVLVHFFNGLTEMHFHYFVVVAVVALYQAWTPYLLALGFVLLQHTFIGILAPRMVYDHMDAQYHPWTWALIHGGFVLAESVACLMYWRITEDALDREREARVGFENAHQDLTAAQTLSSIGSWDWDVSSDRMGWSEQLYTLTGSDMRTFVPSVAGFLSLVQTDDRDRVAELLATSVREGVGLDYESQLVRADGEIRTFHALGEHKAAPGGLVRMIGTIHDVTERRALQGEIERLAFHDPLTGLANRRLFLDRLDLALAGHRRSGRGCAVLFMDLDDFKKINDVLGHGAGDELLCVVAERLVASVRPSDTVARFGGDEFALLLEQVDLETSTRLAERLEIELRQPIQIQGAQRSIRGSIGIAVAEAGITADGILRNADAAMYAAKVGGKHSPRAFPSSLSSP